MVASIKMITVYDIQYMIYDMLYNVFIHYDMICIYIYALLGELVWYGVECEQR